MKLISLFLKKKKNNKNIKEKNKTNLNILTLKYYDSGLSIAAVARAINFFFVKKKG